MKTSWSKAVRRKVQTVAEAIAEAARAALTPAHVCDPNGFRCDCARRRAINARATGRARGGLDGRRRDGRAWFDREG